MAVIMIDEAEVAALKEEARLLDIANANLEGINGRLVDDKAELEGKVDTLEYELIEVSPRTQSRRSILPIVPAPALVDYDAAYRRMHPVAGGNPVVAWSRL